MNIFERLKNAENKTNIYPTEAQKWEGNYRKGKLNIRGFQVSIENPVGSTRSGVSPDGHKWSVECKNTYGYFRGTVGKDGDGIDVYFGSELFTDTIYIIDQIDPNTGLFDEHKVMFGFKTIEEAEAAYLSNFEPHWKGLGFIGAIRIDLFRRWLYDSKTSIFPFAKYKNKLQTVNTVFKENVEYIILDGEVVEGETLTKLQAQIEGEFDVLMLEIISHGGSVSEGLKIMLWLKELIEAGKYIVTIVSANAYSIASLIAQVANERYISTHGEIMVHNPMYNELTFVNADELELYAKELRELQDYLNTLYSTFTGLDSNDVKQIMDKETYLTPQVAVQLGFADHIINAIKKPYSKVEFKIKPNMSKLKGTLAVLRAAIAIVNGQKIVNQSYNTLSGQEIEIYQTDASTYSLGDKVSEKEGEFTLGDGTKIIVEDYTIKDLIKPGTIIEPTVVEPTVEPSVEPVPAIESVTKIEDPKMVEINPEAFAALLEAVEGLTEAVEKLQTENATLKSEIETLKAKTDTGLQTLEEFQMVATEAISNIATKTASTWTPPVKSQAKVEKTALTPFQRALEARKQA